MNEKKGITNTIIIIGLIIIIALLVTMMVLLVKNQTTIGIAQEDSTSKVEKIEDNTNTENDPEGMSGKVVTKEMTADEKYKVYAEGMKKSLSKLEGAGVLSGGGEFGSKDIYIWSSSASDDITDLDDYACGAEEIMLDYTGTAYLSLDENSILGKKYGTKYKIKSDVIKAGISAWGQDASCIIWIINEKGELSYIDFHYLDPQTPTLELKDYKDIKNIVDIEYSYNGMNPNGLCAIDIDGNIHELEF